MVLYAMCILSPNESQCVGQVVLYEASDEIMIYCVNMNVCNYVMYA